MADDSEWDVLQVRLTQLREAVAAEIRAYPAPIPACDAQYNHLLERRTALAAALASLDATREGDTTPEQFRLETRVLTEG